MSDFRIISLLPGATEMVASLGLSGSLVGISHECDFPAEILGLPIVVRPLENYEGMSSAAIDDAVRKRAASGAPFYAVDEKMLAELAPTHIIAQDICHVCAPSGGELEKIAAALPSGPQIITLSPRSLTDIAQDLRRLGEIFSRQAEAEALLIEWKSRVDHIQQRVNDLPRVRCFLLEWADPLYCSGHWVAEMVQMAGGFDALARPGQESVRISWEELRASAPEVLLISPCGYDVDHAAEELKRLQSLPGFEELPAVRNGKVYALNAGAFITRPGPRVVDGIEMLAYLLHQ